MNYLCLLIDLLLFPGEVVDIVLKNVEKPSIYQRALAASALWALLTQNQKVSLHKLLNLDKKPLIS